MRVVIVEDDTLLREGLVLLLEASGIEVATAVDTIDDFLAFVREDRPDAVITDVRLPPTHTDEGLRAAMRARQLHPGLPVLVLSAHVEIGYVAELLDDGEGGVGYLLKQRVGKVAKFVDSLERVVEGGTAMDPEVVSQLLTRRRDPVNALTAREREVLGLMAEGYNNAAIAELLSVSDGTVLKHNRNIFAKLGLPEDTGHRRVLAVLAYLNGRW